MTSFWLFLVPVILAYTATCQWVLDRWFLPDSYYSHGPLVPLVAAVVLWLRRDDWAAPAARVDLRGWLFLGPGLAVHLLGAGLMIDSLSAASMIVSLAGVVWLGMGAKRLNRLWPVLALTLFAIPTPIFVTGNLAFELKEIAIGLSQDLCGVVGLEVQRKGADLFVAPHLTTPLKVADACSGLRSLLALTTLGYCVAFFMGPQRGMRRWILLLSAMPIAVITNVFRITGICWVARSEGVVYAGGDGHEILRWAAWIVAMGLLLVLDRVLTRRTDEVAQ